MHFLVEKNPARLNLALAEEAFLFMFYSDDRLTTKQKSDSVTIFFGEIV